MVKKRVIPLLLTMSGRLVKGRNFKHYRDTGTLQTALRTFSAQDADELIFVDLDRTEASFSSTLELVRSVIDECYMPIAIGGGIHTVSQVGQLLETGADKVIVTTEAFRNPSMLNEIINLFGAQALIVGVDYILGDRGTEVYVDLGQERTHQNVDGYVRFLNDVGVGEIMLNCISRDGTLSGFDLDTIEKVSSASSVPVIASGGAKNFQCLVDLFERTEASGAAVGSLFYFGDNNPIRARAYLTNAGVPSRSLK